MEQELKQLEALFEISEEAQAQIRNLLDDLKRRYQYTDELWEQRLQIMAAASLVAQPNL